MSEKLLVRNSSEVRPMNGSRAFFCRCCLPVDEVFDTHMLASLVYVSVLKYKHLISHFFVFLVCSSVSCLFKVLMVLTFGVDDFECSAVNMLTILTSTMR
jgi:hypothetical protein